MLTDWGRKLPEWAPLVLRLALAAVFISHGAQKAFGWFGGHGFAATTAFVGSLGFQPAILWAALLTVAEFGGGILLLLGLMTRIAAGGIFIAMTVAMFMVHWSRGFFISGGGIEFVLALAAMALSLVMLGAGRLSIDRAIGWKLG